MGVSRVFRTSELPQAIELAKRYPGELLMEQLIDGDEFTVAILGEEALPSIQIVPAGEYYDYHAKYIAEDTQYLCPGLTGAAEEEIEALALSAFHAAGCSGWGRVDLMRDPQGRNLPSRGQHHARHDEPFAGAESGACARHRLRRAGLAHPRVELRAGSAMLNCATASDAIAASYAAAAGGCRGSTGSVS